MGDTPNVSNSLTIRVQFKNDSGMLGLLTSEIGRLGGDIGSVDLTSVGDGVMVRDLTINCRDDAHAAPHVRIMATGRSDHPNQVNNVLAFPGVFRGALDVRATTINDEMKRAAAYAIAGVIPADESHEDYITPSVFDKTVVKAVAKAARENGVARRETKD